MTEVFLAFIIGVFLGSFLIYYFHTIETEDLREQLEDQAKIIKELKKKV